MSPTPSTRYNTIMRSHHSDLSNLKDRIAKITEFLTQPLPQSILATHPNDLPPDFTIGDSVPKYWDAWWNWATEESHSEVNWLQLIKYHNAGRNGAPTNGVENRSHIPSNLVDLIDTIRALQLDRECQKSNSTLGLHSFTFLSF